MRDEASVSRALVGARYLFHLAAHYRLWARDPGEIERNNIEGTGAVMRAALQQRVERVVYTSSVATLRVNSETTTPATEDAPLASNEATGAYKRSKVLAERLVVQMVAQDSLPAIIVNPSTPIGAHDVRPTPTGRVIIEAATGKMPAFVDTGRNLVDVEDVALGHLLALDHGRIGETSHTRRRQHHSAADAGRNRQPDRARRPPRVKLPSCGRYFRSRTQPKQWRS